MKNYFKYNDTDSLCRLLEHLFDMLAFPCRTGKCRLPMKKNSNSNFQQCCCCCNCAASEGFLHPHRKHSGTIIELFQKKYGWNSEKGFLSEKGCLIPRKHRSITCNSYCMCQAIINAEKNPDKRAQLGIHLGYMQILAGAVAQELNRRSEKEFARLCK